MTIYYVYAYLRQYDSSIAKAGTPYYIGKGKDARAWAKEHRINLPNDRSNVVILEYGLTELWALARERWYIRWYGRVDKNTGILRNLTDGGEGASGRINNYGLSGPKNPSFDKTVYTFYHNSGSIETSTQYEFRKKYNIKAANLSEVIRGNQKSVRGWRMTLEKKPDLTGKLQPGCDTLYTFYHPEYGTETLTQRELYLKYQLPTRSGISNLCHKKVNSYKRWKLVK
jgi:hypothetical protein